MKASNIFSGIVITGLLFTMGLMHNNHLGNATVKNSQYVQQGAEYEQALFLERTANADLRRVVGILTNSKPLVFTAYNALVNQTDDTPNITASNKQIYGGGLALSREMLIPYGYGGAYIEYGDTVLVMLEMVVEDTMNKRWISRGDVYMINYAEAVQFGHKKGKLYHYDGPYN